MTTANEKKKKQPGSLWLLSAIFWTAVCLVTAAAVMRPHVFSEEILKGAIQSVVQEAMSLVPADSRAENGSSASADASAAVEYVSSPDEIPAEILEVLDRYAKSEFEEQVREVWTPEEHLDSMELMETHFLLPVSEDAPAKNILVLCYQLQYSNDERNFTAPYYRYAWFYNVPASDDPDVVEEYITYWAPEEKPDSDWYYAITDGYYVTGFPDYESMIKDITVRGGIRYREYSGTAQDNTITFHQYGVSSMDGSSAESG